MIHVLISGNCQRYAIAAQLSLWFPNWQIVTVDTNCADVESIGKESLPLDSVNIWICIGQLAATQKSNIQAAFPGLKILSVPAVGFAAFHPDLCFVQDRRKGQSPPQIFHSAIVAWAYRNHCKPEATLGLFNAATFKDLGYLNAWPESVHYLKRAFQASALAPDFEAFFLAVKRHGCFMHTFNHPKAFAITLLTKLICQKLGEPLPSNARDLDDNATALSATQWPVYPEIAQHLGVPTKGYQWFDAGKEINNLEDFVNEAFIQYQQADIAPENLALVNRDPSLYDRVLNQRLRLSSCQN